MVALSGPGWRVAPCLEALFDEADRRDPNRDTSSDGTIGNPEHAARASDHNPDDGWVCAGDIDDDNDQPSPGVDLLRQHLVASKDDRVKYLIRNGTIWKAYPNRGLPAWTPQVYTGPNAHLHHLHISVWNTPEARNDLRPWWPEEDPMADPKIQAQLDRMEKRIEDVARGVTIVAGAVAELDADLPENTTEILAELRRNLRTDLKADGVPATDIET